MVASSLDLSTELPLEAFPEFQYICFLLYKEAVPDWTQAKVLLKQKNLTDDMAAFDARKLDLEHLAMAL